MICMMNYGIDLDEEEEALKLRKRRETGKESTESFKQVSKKHLRDMMMKMNLKDTMRMIFGLQKT